MTGIAPGVGFVTRVAPAVGLVTGRVTGEAAGLLPVLRAEVVIRIVVCGHWASLRAQYGHGLAPSETYSFFAR